MVCVISQNYPTREHFLKNQFIQLSYGICFENIILETPCSIIVVRIDTLGGGGEAATLAFHLGLWLAENLPTIGS